MNEFNPKNLINCRLAGFRILSELGEGNNGIVYLARQLSMDRDVALKVLKPEWAVQEEYVKNFLHEARLAARLDHPNIVQALDAGSSPEGYYFFAMEYVKGVSLEDLRLKNKIIELKTLVQISIQLADALSYAWITQQMTHGDIKPGNLLIRENDGMVKLADLGLARVSGGALQEEMMATPLYAAPEVILAQHDQIGVKSDLYSFGVMFYELTAGRPPFSGQLTELLKRHLEELPIPLGDCAVGVDWQLSNFIDRLLEKSPENRPENWSEIGAFFRQYYENHWGENRAELRQSGQLPPPPPQSAEHKKNNFLKLSLLGILLLIPLMILGAFFYFAIDILMLSQREEEIAPPPTPVKTERIVPPDLVDEKKGDFEVALTGKPAEPPPPPLKPEQPKHTKPPKVPVLPKAPPEPAPPQRPTTVPEKKTSAQVVKPLPPIAKVLPANQKNKFNPPVDQPRLNRHIRQTAFLLQRLNSRFSESWKREAIEVVGQSYLLLSQFETEGYSFKTIARFDQYSGKSATWQSIDKYTGAIRVNPQTPPIKIAHSLGTGFYECLLEEGQIPRNMADDFAETFESFVRQRMKKAAGFTSNPVSESCRNSLEEFVKLLKSGQLRQRVLHFKNLNRQR